MRICVLADGESIHTIRWCKHFYELGHEIHLISFKNVSMDGVLVHFINSGKINVEGGNWRTILKFNEVRGIIKKISPDVLHALYATSYGTIGALSGFHPYIVTPLGTDILISPNNSFIYRSLLKFTLKKADRITSMAPHMKEAMLRLGVPDKKIIDIILGINTEVFNRKNRKLSSTEFIITSTRNFELIYNIPHFLRSIAIVKNKIPNLKVNLLGDGSLKDELKTLVEDLNIKDIVTFIGKVPQNQVLEILNHSHIFCTVSLSDGNSLSLLEAMACGTYPIATDILANREWIIDNLNGSFVKIDDVEGLADKILYVYHNFNNLIEKVNIENDTIIATKGTWKINMQKMEKIYEELALHE